LAGLKGDDKLTEKLNDLQKAVLKDYYTAQLKGAVLGLYIFTDMEIDEIQDFILDFCHYDIRAAEIVEHHRKVMKDD
jgi:hypothetical protein